MDQTRKRHSKEFKAKVAMEAMKGVHTLGKLASLGVRDLRAIETAAETFTNQWPGTSKADFIGAKGKERPNSLAGMKRSVIPAQCSALLGELVYHRHDLLGFSRVSRIQSTLSRPGSRNTHSERSLGQKTWVSPVARRNVALERLLIALMRSNGE